jgi:hypothetical protein
VGPAIQVKVIEVAALAETTSARFKGASGLVSIIAPLPTADSADEPYKL